MMDAAHTPIYGPPSVLELRRLPVPQPGPGELLVRVEASAVTAGDLRVRAADFGPVLGVVGRLFLGLRGPRRAVQGTTFAGVVAQVGPGVERFAVGTPVFGSVPAGAWARYLVVSAAGAVARRPAGVSAPAAAAVPYGAGTAWTFLHDLAQVQPDERVLVLGGAGGVGRYAVQIARHLGAHVTATASARSLPFLRTLGAHVALDRHRTDPLAAGQTWDVVLDTADAATFGQCRPVLRPGGRYLTLAASLRILLQALWTRWRGGPRALFTVSSGTREKTERLAELLDSGAIRPVVAPPVPLTDIAHAHHQAAAGGTGTVVVVPGGASQGGEL